MNSKSRKPLKIDQILSLYQSGATSSRICLTFGLSERRYYELLKRHSVEFQSVKEIRLMAQKKKLSLLRDLHKGPKVDLVKTKERITANEKLAQLERRLEIERKKNLELEGLLKLAQEHLGKF